MTLPSEIKIVRQKTFLSQTAFAQELGVSYTTVNRWETGKARPNLSAMKNIKDFCEKKKVDYTPVETAWINSTVSDE